MAVWLLQELRDYLSSWERVYKRAVGSIVELYSVQPSKEPGKTSAGSGTGFVFEVKGRRVVLTNHHVTACGGITLAQFRDGFKTALHVLDGSPRCDLAALTPAGSTLEKYKPLPPAAKRSLRLGEKVMAIGHPIGETNHISVGFFTGELMRGGQPRLRLSMTVDPGNSGGPLFDQKGRVVGVIVAKHKQSENIAYAVPMRLVEKLAVGEEIGTPGEDRGGR